MLSFSLVYSIQSLLLFWSYFALQSYPCNKICSHLLNPLCRIYLPVSIFFNNSYSFNSLYKNSKTNIINKPVIAMKSNNRPKPYSYFCIHATLNSSWIIYSIYRFKEVFSLEICSNSKIKFKYIHLCAQNLTHSAGHQSCASHLFRHRFGATTILSWFLFSHAPHQPKVLLGIILCLQTLIKNISYQSWYRINIFFSI